MSFAELIRARYAVRAYRPDPVPDTLLAQVLEAGRLAPTAANRQPIGIIVVHTAGREAELGRIYGREWFVRAPLVLCVCTVPREAWTRTASDGRSYADVDAAIVMDHLVLAATELGLGTCWIVAFDPAAARDVLALPDGVEPLVFTPLGFPADQPTAKERRPLAELVHHERW
ncbi:MAG TPA: nitroreductase family protein [Candidatus Nanopelagicales bacterium]|nr:nitroreductase family protein [Candidatus Nanopelagicales bacterium]